MVLTSSIISFWPSPLRSQVLLVLQCVTLCFAQDNSSMAIASTASANTAALSSSVIPGPAQTHTIQVGLADHKFVPNITQAAVGDILEFRFYPLNHSVVRAEYLVPCIPYEMSGPSKTGFFGGFHAVDKVLEDAPSYSIRVNDTNPIFFYCSAPGSCLNYGMVGAVNPSKDQDIEQQHQKAKNSAYMLNPGEPFPPEGTTGSGNITGSTGAGNGGGTVADTNARGNYGLSKGAIAGIVVGGIAVVVLAASLFFFWGRTKSLEDEVDRKAGTVRRVSSAHGRDMMERKDMNGNNHNNNSGGGGGGVNGLLATYPHFQPNNIIMSGTSSLADMLQQQHQHQHQHRQNTYNNAPPPPPPPPALPTYHHQNETLKYNTASPTGHPAYHILFPHSTSSFSPPSQHYPYPANLPLSTASTATTTAAAATAAATATAGTATTTAGTSAFPPAPSYFETVHRPGPVHLNGWMGAPVAVEMEAGAGVETRGEQQQQQQQQQLAEDKETEKEKGKG